MDAAQLARWAELDRRRRALAVAWPGRLATGFPLAALAGLAAAAALAWLGHRDGAAEAHTWWSVIAGCATAGVVMRAPFRMYWRHDATLLARLPIGGDALYGLAARRSLRAGAQVALALGLAALPVAFAGHVDATGALAWLRFVAIVAGSCAAAALLTPPLGALAGALVADEKLSRGLASMAGEASGPPLIWLSFLPAMGGLGAGGVMYLSAPWAAEGTSTAGLTAAALVGGALALTAVVWLLGRRRLAAMLPFATREVAALDAVKLATLQLDTARGLEALFGRALAGGGVAGAIYKKDVALARRRHPMFFLLAGLGLLVLWITAAFAGAPTRERWSLGVVTALALYLAVFGRRLARPDIEQPRLMITLPIASGSVTRAKWTFVLWRAIFIVAAVAPCVVRAPGPGGLALQLGAILAASLLVSGAASRISRL